MVHVRPHGERLPARPPADLEAETARRILDAVIEGTSDDVFVKDLEGRFVAANAAAAATLGRPREELIGRTVHELLPGPVADAMAETDRLVLAYGKVETFEELVPATAGTRALSTTKGPYRAADGTILGTFGIARDVGPLAAAGASLHASQERLSRALDAGNAGWFDWVLDTGAVTFSRGLERLLRLAPGDFGGTYEDTVALVAPEDLRAIRSHVRDALRAGVAVVTVRMRRADGELVHMELTTRVHYEEGLPVAMSGVAADVGERVRTEQLEEQLRQGQRLEALGRLAGGIAHDFNNLLTAINGYGDLALAELDGLDGRGGLLRESVEQIRRAGSRGATMTQQLLAFSRQQELELEVVDLNVVVGDFETMLTRLLGAGIEVRFELADDIGPVEADPGQLGQVVLNLAVNARDAMPDGGTLTLETSDVEVGPRAGATAVPPGRYSVLTVTDTGSGIPADVLERIFEPFYTTKELGDGTGLGLATVLGIVEQSGGRLTVESEPGRGSTFRVFLPRTAAAPQAPPPPDGAPRGSGRVLLVEDDDVVRALVRELLEREDYEVSEAATPNEALELSAASPGPIDLLVTDVVMPAMNGRELAARLTEARPGLAVVYLSGYTAAAVMERGILADGVFLRKPFTAAQLGLKVREALRAAQGAGS